MLRGVMPVTAAPRVDQLGLLFLIFTAAGWGMNWPPMKLLLAELPPFAARSVPMLGAALLLALVVSASGQSLRVPRGAWGRLWLAALLNISAWMGLAALALLWLDASEACILAYVAPVLTAILAWPVLGERPTPARIVALVLGFGGVATVMFGRGIDLGLAKLPGILCALGAAALFALGTVLTKQRPPALPLAAGVVWQIGLGAVPMVVLAALFETPDYSGLSRQGWLLIGWMAVVPLCLCYLTWFAALRRLPAGLATLGTLLAPLIGVGGSALLLGEPFGTREVAALGLTLGGVVLAARG